MTESKEVIYREVQYFRQVWVVILVLGFALYMWYGAIQQVIYGVPVGDNPAPDIVLIILWALFGVFIPIFMLVMNKLVTEVRTDGIYIRFKPFHIKYRMFLWEDINRYEAITYSSLARFGGWGLRSGYREIAYNVSGDRAVELHLKNKVIVLGTKDIESLTKAIDSVEKNNK